MLKWRIKKNIVLFVSVYLILNSALVSSQVGCGVTSDCVPPLFTCAPGLVAFCEPSVNVCTCITPTPTPPSGNGGSSSSSNFLKALWWLIWFYYASELYFDTTTTIFVYPDSTVEFIDL